MKSDALKVMVLAGGPDREREVSLDSGRNVAAALRQAGHEVLERDATPGDLTALDEFVRWGGDVIFPVLHGAWGEGGQLQQLLDQKRLAYVGCRTKAARLCMDKAATKRELVKWGLPTPASALVAAGDPCHIGPPAVVKPVCEGSSIDIAICKTQGELDGALKRLIPLRGELLVEQFVPGKEMTIGVIDGKNPGDPPVALPPIRIIPATEFYDYEAKYNRDDTRYLLDPVEIGLPIEAYQRLKMLAVSVYGALGCRHMARVDVMVDEANRPWVLEVNTIPGFTGHSLLPMAARHAGIEMAALTDRLARMAARDRAAAAAG